MMEALLLLTLAMPPALPGSGLQGWHNLDAHPAAFGATHNPDAVEVFNVNRIAAAWTRARRNNLIAYSASHAHDLTGVGNFGGVVSPHASEYTPHVDSSDQVGTMGRYVPEPAGMLGAASLRSVQAEDAGPSQREERAVHALLAANAFFSVGSRLFTQRCLGEQTCYERNKLTRDLYTNRPKTGIMVQAASTAIENYLLWRIHDNADKRAWVRAAIVGVLAFNIWNFSNDLRVYKQTGRNR